MHACSACSRTHTIFFVCTHTQTDKNKDILPPSLLRLDRDHLAKRDLWGLTELWQTCEEEAHRTSGHRHVSCRIYESRLDLLRQEADIVAGPASRNRPSSEYSL